MSMEPILIEKKAIDIIPYYNGIYCTIEDGEPFVNQIVNRRWTEDGEYISFMLDSHNFTKAKPDEIIEVVEMDSHIPEGLIEKDRERMAKKPECKGKCSCCGQVVSE